MNLTVTGHHVTITPAIRGYVEAKLERVLRHCDHVTAQTSSDITEHGGWRSYLAHQ